LSQITRVMPFRLIILQFLHIRLTDDLTFMPLRLQHSNNPTSGHGK
jgi:hypothetical protein